MPAQHPTETQLALYAGDDLRVWERWRVRRHVASCSECRHEIQAYRQAAEDLQDIEVGLPGQVNWARLSDEMTGNIRVGFAAGECIADFEKHGHPVRPRLLWRAALVMTCLSLVVVSMVWLKIPGERMDHWVSSLRSVRMERIGPIRTPPAVQDAVVLEANPSSIEVKANGSALSLMHPRSDGATVSVNMQDSAGVRYVDADTGQVTMNRVYYAQ